MPMWVDGNKYCASFFQVVGPIEHRQPAKATQSRATSCCASASPSEGRLPLPATWRDFLLLLYPADFGTARAAFDTGGTPLRTGMALFETGANCLLGGSSRCFSGLLLPLWRGGLRLRA